MIDFSRFRKAIDRKNAAAFTLERTKARATKVTTTITGQPRGTSTGKQVEEGVIQIMEAEEALQARTAELQAFKDALEAEMDKLKDERQIKFIRFRYMDEKSVPNIAIRESYSESTVYDEIRKAERVINRTK